MQLGDLADREAGREAAAQARGDDFIAHLHAGTERDVAQFQAVAAPVDDQPHAIARHADRHCVVGVGEQQHGGMQRGDFDHLPHQAAGIDHRLAQHHPFAATGVQQQALARRIQIDVQDRRQLHIQTAALGHVEQFAQLRVIQGRGLQPGQARIGDQQLVAQIPGLFHQLRMRCGVVAHLRADASRQPGHRPDRLDQQIGLHAHLAEPTTAAIERNQHDRQHQIDQQAQRGGDFARTGGDGRTGVGGHCQGREWGVGNGESGSRWLPTRRVRRELTLAGSRCNHSGP